jgi:geranylgeranyl diphosphate synthase type I
MLDTPTPAAGTAEAGEEALREGARLVEPHLRTIIDSLHGDVARVCRHHLGWTQDPTAPHRAGTTGKGVRAALAVLSARSCGSPDETAAAAGTAVELVHQFSLLHDDVMDGDHERRGRPAAWVAFGIGPAVLAGDALLVQAVSALFRTGTAHLPDALRQLLAALNATIDGQAEDLALEHLPARAVPPRRYLHMAAAKTGALLGCATSLGALLTGQPERARHLQQAGTALGVGFQIIDDVLGLWGDRTVTGKPVGTDLLRGKKTLPLLLALSSGTPAGQNAAALLESHPPSAHSLARLTTLLDQAGARAAAGRAAEEQLRVAAAALDRAELPPAQRERWDGLMAALVRRTR